jgi:hypothetical protein
LSCNGFEPEPFDIFTLDLDEAEMAESILRGAQFEADAEREVAEEEQEHVADPKADVGTRVLPASRAPGPERVDFL